MERSPASLANTSSSAQHSQPPETFKEKLNRYSIEEGVHHVWSVKMQREKEDAARNRAVEGTNRANQRRAPSVPPSNPLQRPQFQDGFKECSEEPIFRRGRDKDKECDTRECTRRSSLSPSWESRQRKPRHEALEMSGSRPGKVAHNEHNPAARVFKDPIRDRSSSPKEIPKPQESAESYVRLFIRVSTQGCR